MRKATKRFLRKAIGWLWRAGLEGYVRSEIDQRVAKEARLFDGEYEVLHLIPPAEIYPTRTKGAPSLLTRDENGSRVLRK